MNYYFLEYATEKAALEDLEAKGLISSKEDFVQPMDIHFLGVVLEYDYTDIENPTELSSSGYLVNVWGKGSYDFGLTSREPRSPYCIPSGYRPPQEISIDELN